MEGDGAVVAIFEAFEGGKEERCGGLGVGKLEVVETNG